jgi:hypothetical protein
MSLYTVHDSEGGEQPPQSRASESPVSYALRALGRLLSESPLAYEQFQEARYDRAEAERLDVEAKRARQETSGAEARVVAERHKAGPHKRLSRPAGTAIAVALALLDALPAYWSAQAFGLDQSSTVILTVLLCAALGGAMWLLDLFAEKGRGLALRILGSTLGVGFLALFALRLNYLQVTGGQSLWQAALGAFELTALSATFVAVGFVVLANRAPKAVNDAQRAVRQAAGGTTAQAARAARVQADRSRAALEATVVTWALSREPEGFGHEQLLEAFGEALNILLKRKGS